MIKISNKSDDKFVLSAVFKGEVQNELIIEKQNHITEITGDKKAFVFLGDKNEFDLVALMKTTKGLMKSIGRDYQIDVATFVPGVKPTEKDMDRVEVTNDLVTKWLVDDYELANTKIWTKKASPKEFKAKEIELLNVENEENFKKYVVLAEANTWTRGLQIMPPNVLNSETYSKYIQDEFKGLKNLKVTVLGKSDLEKYKMGLLLSVNLGSAYEPKIVVIEYKGDPSSKDIQAYVGKGITFDAGGYNIKTGAFMANMKHDMSGSAIVAGTMMAISKLGAKQNVTAVLPMTDNMINPVASTPDAVFTGMNGKTVEILNTDAEGRLILADAVTYAADIIGANRILSIATLTGAMKYSLGIAYTGIWSTKDTNWENMKEASIAAGEPVWRMPLDGEYLRDISQSPVADLTNIGTAGVGGGSNSAAMFIKEFAQGKEFMHVDVAATADINKVPTAEMVRTLFEFVQK